MDSRRDRSRGPSRLHRPQRRAPALRRRSVESERHLEVAQSPRGGLMAEVEEHFGRRAARVWTLSAADAQALGDLGARATKVFGLPPALAARDIGEPTHDIGLLGTWTWELNEAGLNWFLDEVQPLLGDELSVAIAGAGSERYSQRSRPNVRCLGRVEMRPTSSPRAGSSRYPPWRRPVSRSRHWTHSRGGSGGRDVGGTSRDRRRTVERERRRRSGRLRAGRSRRRRVAGPARRCRGGGPAVGSDAATAVPG